MTRSLRHRRIDVDRWVPPIRLIGERLNRVRFDILSHMFKTETYVYEITARLTPTTHREHT